MAAIATFGVAETDVEGSTYGLVITASTVPTSTQLSDLITEAGAEISAVMYAKGIAPGDLTTTDEGYQLGRQYVRKYAARECMLAAQHRLDVAEQYRLDCVELRGRIEESAARLGSSRKTGEGSPDTPRFTTQATTDVETALNNAGNVRASMRYRREL